MKKRFLIHDETVYVSATLILAFAVAMLSAADFGVSMIVAPAYIISLKFPVLTFGQSEYALQTVLLIIFCLLIKKFKPIYLSAYFTCIFYGAVLDLWRAVIPVFNPHITPAGSMAMATRIIFFIVGMLLTSLSIALFFSCYLYPQVYDFFVKGASEHFNIELTKFKRFFDITFLVLATALSLIFFKKFVGVGVGTLIITVCNSFLIKFFKNIFSRFFVTEPFLKNFAKHFDIQ